MKKRYCYYSYTEIIHKIGNKKRKMRSLKLTNFEEQKMPMLPPKYSRRSKQTISCSQIRRYFEALIINLLQRNC